MGSRLSKALVAIATWFGACGAAYAAVGPFDTVIVFGDSLSDVGNLYAATSAVGFPTPGAPYFQGRYSNGRLWVEHVAGVYGVTLAPSFNGGNDYAFAGAETTEDRPFSADGITVDIPSLKTQALAYLVTVLGQADPRALYVIWGGGNDALDVAPAAAAALPAKFASKTAKIVKLLKAAGARYFLIPSVPDIGVTPEVSAGGVAASAAATALAKAMNVALAAALANPALDDGITLYTFNPLRGLQEVVEGTTHFGFTDVTTPCIAGAGSVPCADPDHTLFWDDYHPTAFGHAFVAIEAETVLPKP